MNPGRQSGAASGMSIRAIAFASAVGTTIEWYDFFLFGVLTPLVLNKLFFPNYDPLVGNIVGLHDVFRRLHLAPYRRLNVFDQ